MFDFHRPGQLLDLAPVMAQALVGDPAEQMLAEVAVRDEQELVGLGERDLVCREHVEHGAEDPLKPRRFVQGLFPPDLPERFQDQARDFSRFWQIAVERVETERIRGGSGREVEDLLLAQEPRVPNEVLVKMLRQISVRIDDSRRNAEVHQTPEKMFYEERLAVVRRTDEVEVRRQVLLRFEVVQATAVLAAAQEQLAVEERFRPPDGFVIDVHWASSGRASSINSCNRGGRIDESNP